ncbi:MAG: hypothetical protein JXR95_12725 [Deltaproteobacteria bacterium]|nr:hypothetical protein [Deltaproteobacteria bacterium]
MSKFILFVIFLSSCNSENRLPDSDLKQKVYRPDCKKITPKYISCMKKPALLPELRKFQLPFSVMRNSLTVTHGISQTRGSIIVVTDSENFTKGKFNKIEKYFSALKVKTEFLIRDIHKKPEIWKNHQIDDKSEKNSKDVTVPENNYLDKYIKIKSDFLLVNNVFSTDFSIKSINSILKIKTDTSEKINRTIDYLPETEVIKKMESEFFLMCKSRKDLKNRMKYITDCGNKFSECNQLIECINHKIASDYLSNSQIQLMKKNSDYPSFGKSGPEIIYIFNPLNSSSLRLFIKFLKLFKEYPVFKLTVFITSENSDDIEILSYFSDIISKSSILEAIQFSQSFINNRKFSLETSKKQKNLITENISFLEKSFINQLPTTIVDGKLIEGIQDINIFKHIIMLINSENGV